MAKKELISLIHERSLLQCSRSRKTPGNEVVVQAGVEDWNRLLAQAYGFPDLIPSEAESQMFHIAVGKNSNGDIVGAKLLQETSKDFAMREASLNFLSHRAQLIFGLKPSDYSVDD